MDRSTGWLCLGAFLVCGGQARAGVVRDAVPPPGFDEAARGRRVALLVGVEAYADEALRGLRFSAEDATDLADVLVDPDLGGFDEVRTLTGEVTRADFWAAWEDLARAATGADTLLVFFAGHGTLEVAAENRLHLLLSDSRLDAPSGTGLRLEILERAIARLPSRHRVLIVDACHSGRGRSAWSERTRQAADRMRGPPAAPPLQPVGRYDVELFAAHLDQVASEDPLLENGVYTYFLVEALRGAGDWDGDGVVDVWEAHEYALAETMRRTDGLQTPWIRATRVGVEALVLSGDPALRHAAETAVLGGIDPWAGVVARVDGTASTAALRMDPGRHRVEIEQHGRLLWRGTVDAAAGDQLDVAAIVADSGRRVLAVGATGVAGGVAAGPWQVGIQGWRALDASVPGRVWLGGVAEGGWGSIAGAGPLAHGHAMGRVAWTRGERLLLGPSLGAGGVWRAPDRQGGPMASLGAHAALPAGPVLVGVDPQVWLLPIWSASHLLLDRWAVAPTVQVSVGVLR